MRRWLSRQFWYRKGCIDLAFGADAKRIFGKHQIRSGLRGLLRGPP